MSAKAERTSSHPRPLLALIPIVLMLAMVALFLQVGPAQIFPGEFPPVEEVGVGKVTLKPGEIKMVVTNGGPAPVTIAQVLVDEAYWNFKADRSGEIPRLKSTTITIPYPWVETEPIAITLVSSTGVTFEHVIDVAVETPPIDLGFLGAFALLGIFIGLVPVVLGMTWMPFLRTLSPVWLTFFMAFTAGVLIFLGIETLGEAIEQAQALPSAVGGLGVVAFGAIAAFALILVAGRKLKQRSKGDERMAVALTVAAGIGLHNLGEGLAVGAAYRLGEIALGAFLVIGFAIHNTTEGIGIVSILGSRKTSLAALAGLGILAGLPTVLGAWAGAFFFTPSLAAIFLAIAAGAIAEVVFDVLAFVRKESGTLGSAAVLGGIAVGVAAMYLTGVLVVA